MDNPTSSASSLSSPSSGLSDGASQRDVRLTWAFRLTDKKGHPVEVPTPLAPLADTHGHLTVFRSTDPAEALARAILVGVQLLVAPLDPTEDVPDIPCFMSWWDRQLSDAQELLARAATQGVTPPDFAATFSTARHLSPDFPCDLHFIAGVHPYGARIFLEDVAARERLDVLLNDPRCVGIGEIGLDLGPYNVLPADVQEEAFRLQLRMAHERNLPVELHIRDGKNDTHAHDMAFRILQEEGRPQAGCDLHCYTSNPDVMAPFVEMGCHIAFGGAVTFKHSEEIRAAAAACPAQLLLSETDCPYMAPVPLRGAECQPAMIAFSVACLADVRASSGQVSHAATYRQLWENARRFFRLP